MKLYKIIFLFSFFIVSLFTQQRKVYYTEKLELYGVSFENISSLIVNAIFQGTSEIESFNAIQKKYFYALPIPQKRIKKYKPGYYIVSEYPEKLLTVIEEPEEKIKIILKYLPNKNSGKKISEKITTLDNSVVDKVTYIYRKDRLYAVKSDLFGIKFFEETTDTYKQIIRYFQKLYYAFF